MEGLAVSVTTAAGHLEELLTFASKVRYRNTSTGSWGTFLNFYKAPQHPLPLLLLCLQHIHQ